MALEEIAYELGRTAAENFYSLGAAAAILGSTGVAARKMLDSKTECMTCYELQEASDSALLTSSYYKSKLEEREVSASGSNYSVELADD